MKTTTKIRIPNPKRRGWHWLKKGQKVKATDAFQWTYPDISGHTSSVGTHDVSEISSGPDNHKGAWSGYIRRNKK